MQPRQENLIDGATGPWEVVIGMEVHAQVTSKSKLFSGASTEFGGEPNSHVSLVDAAMPGMLPVINEECVRQAIRTGLGLRAQINLYSVFDRKNYFYPDLPQGYQISQYKFPIVGEGVVTVDMKDGYSVEVGIERVHLEQDAGKSLHDQHPDYSFVDLNRSGVALMEIVSRPDLRSSEEAKAYITKLRTILRYLGTCDGNMEQGKLARRCQCLGAQAGRALRHALRDQERQFHPLHRPGHRLRGAPPDRHSRSRRHASIRKRGCSIPSSVRPAPCAPRRRRMTTAISPIPTSCPWSWRRTMSMRSRARCPSCPTRRRRASSRILASQPMTPACWSPTRSRRSISRRWPAGRDAKTAANWVTGDLFGALNRTGKSIADSPVSAPHLGELIDLIDKQVISGRIAKDVFEIMVETGEAPGKIVESRGLKQVTDTGAIEKVVDEVIAANPKQVEQVKAKPQTLGWFVGQVMKATGGKANPAAVNAILRKKLGVGDAH